MNICIDLDQTLITTPIINLAAASLGLEKDETDALDWKFSTFPENLRQVIFDYYESEEMMCKKAKVIEGVNDKLEEWKSKGHNLYIITARAENLREPTLNLISNNFPCIDKTFIVGITGSKVTVLKEVEADLLIDDGPHNIEDAMKEGFRCILVSNKYTKYNHHLRELVPWVKVLTDIEI